MRCWKRFDARACAAAVRRCALAFVCAAALSLSCAAAQASPDGTDGAVAAVTVQHGSDPGTFVDAQFAFTMPPSLRSAVDHGIALYFRIEVQIRRSRWYWFDKNLLDRTIEYRLSYSPLTRQYHLSRGGLALPFDTLDQAVATMRRVAHWRVGDASLLDDSLEHVRARIRMMLDTSMLPKPFQVNAITDHDWDWTSGWEECALSVAGAH